MGNPIATERPWWLLPPGRLHPLWWVAVTGVLLWLDYVTDLYTVLPAVYVIPMTLAAWYSGLGASLALAIVTPLAHVGFVVARGTSAEPLAQFIGFTALRGVVIVVMSLWFVRLSQHERELQRHVRQLEELLHICSFCKSIRNEHGQWERLEKVIAERSRTRFSHGLCPDCVAVHYPDLAGQ